jgi:hypothetical protein
LDVFHENSLIGKILMIFPFFISELKKSNNDNQRVGGTGEF